jgi:hypothetical protein
MFDIDPHVQLCLGMQVTLVDPINKCKATSQIIKFPSSTVDKKTIIIKYVIMTIEEIFTPKAIEPFVH